MSAPVANQRRVRVAVSRSVANPRRVRWGVERPVRVVRPAKEVRR